MMMMMMMMMMNVCMVCVYVFSPFENVCGAGLVQSVKNISIRAFPAVSCPAGEYVSINP
jgi:hypothetical protein